MEGILVLFVYLAVLVIGAWVAQAFLAHFSAPPIARIILVAAVIIIALVLVARWAGLPVAL